MRTNDLAAGTVAGMMTKTGEIDPQTPKAAPVREIPDFAADSDA